MERSANVQEFRVAQQRKMSAQRGLSLLPVYRIMSAYIRPWCQGEQQSSEGTCEESWGAALAGMVSSARVVQSWEAARDCRVCKRRSTTCSRRLETYRFILSQRCRSGVKDLNFEKEMIRRDQQKELRCFDAMTEHASIMSG